VHLSCSSLGFAGEAAGIDLRRVEDRETLEAIRAAMDRYAVLVFREQQFTDAEQLARCAPIIRSPTRARLSASSSPKRKSACHLTVRIHRPRGRRRSCARTWSGAMRGQAADEENPALSYFAS
jgi:alpha-ketoglutarate-dependent taurine dioxygenase